TPSSTLPSYVEQLKQELAKKDEELNKFALALRLQRQEQSKVRERLEREQAQNVVNLQIQVVGPLLEIYDNLQRSYLACAEASKAKSAAAADQNNLQGIKLILAQFAQVLKETGVEKLTLKGQPFNPELAEAVATEPCSNPEMDQEILEEYVSGYT